MDIIDTMLEKMETHPWIRKGDGLGLEGIEDFAFSLEERGVFPREDVFRVRHPIALTVTLTPPQVDRFRHALLANSIYLRDDFLRDVLNGKVKKAKPKDVFRPWQICDRLRFRHRFCIIDDIFHFPDEETAMLVMLEMGERFDPI